VRALHSFFSHLTLRAAVVGEQSHARHAVLRDLRDETLTALAVTEQTPAAPEQGNALALILLPDERKDLHGQA